MYCELSEHGWQVCLTSCLLSMGSWRREATLVSSRSWTVLFFALFLYDGFGRRVWLETAPYSFSL
jgi:hypothetical protein